MIEVSMRLAPSTPISAFASEDGGEPGGSQDEEGLERSCNLCGERMFGFLTFRPQSLVGSI